MVDETGFLKKGTHSVGVSRQYSGTAGRIENCQVGVFLGYASPLGQALIDRRLYLPEAWTKDLTRCRRAGVPEPIAFATKTAIARELIGAALEAGAPCAWVLADALYGSDSEFAQDAGRAPPPLCPGGAIQPDPAARDDGWYRSDRSGRACRRP